LRAAVYQNAHSFDWIHLKTKPCMECPRAQQDRPGGCGQTIAIVRGSVACPVAALKAWLAAAGITTGPVFRTVKKGGAVAGPLSAQSVANM
jgi:hypothetical protein